MCDTWFLSAGWATQAQLLQAKVCERGEVCTYLGNLCFSFLRLCLVGGTDTRHCAISSYWALVSIMLGQGLGGGENTEKKHPGLEQPWCPEMRGRHTAPRLWILVLRGFTLYPFHP